VGVIDLSFRKWLRRRPCDICHKGNWNEQKGEWQNEVMHLTARGMGGHGQKCDDIGNCITGCWKCHSRSHGKPIEDFEEEVGMSLRNRAEEIRLAWEG
jgi:hypothetical protein